MIDDAGYGASTVNGYIQSFSQKERKLIVRDFLLSRVERGIERLDTVYPEWRSRVNLVTLDLYSGRYGILEQVFGSYNVGLQMLGLHHSSMYDFGFDVIPWDDERENDEEDMEAWQQLTDAWKGAIADELDH